MSHNEGELFKQLHSVFEDGTALGQRVLQITERLVEMEKHPAAEKISAEMNELMMQFENIEQFLVFELNGQIGYLYELWSERNHTNLPDATDDSAGGSTESP